MKKLYHGNLKVCQPKNLTTRATSDISVSSTIKWHENAKFCLIFKENCSKQINKQTNKNKKHC